MLHCCSLGSYWMFQKKIMAISQGWVISDSWVREDFLVVHNFEVQKIPKPFLFHIGLKPSSFYTERKNTKKERSSLSTANSSLISSYQVKRIQHCQPPTFQKHSLTTEILKISFTIFCFYFLFFILMLNGMVPTCESKRLALVGSW